MTFILTGERETGTITYHCSTTEHAVEKLQDFRRAEYQNISVSTTGEVHVSPRKLLFLARNELNRRLQQ